MAFRRNRRGGFGRGRGAGAPGGRPRGGGPLRSRFSQSRVGRNGAAQSRLTAESLDAELEAYMGEDVVRQRLDRDLESYFASAENAVAAGAAAQTAEGGQEASGSEQRSRAEKRAEKQKREKQTIAVLRGGGEARLSVAFFQRRWTFPSTHLRCKTGVFAEKTRRHRMGKAADSAARGASPRGFRRDAEVFGQKDGYLIECWGRRPLVSPLRFLSGCKGEARLLPNFKAALERLGGPSVCEGRNSFARPAWVENFSLALRRLTLNLSPELSFLFTPGTRLFRKAPREAPSRRGDAHRGLVLDGGRRSLGEASRREWGLAFESLHRHSSNTRVAEGVPRTLLGAVEKSSVRDVFFQAMASASPSFCPNDPPATARAGFGESFCNFSLRKASFIYFLSRRAFCSGGL